MRKLEECRRYEVRLPDGTWEPVHWEQLDRGDVVRQIPNPNIDDVFFDGRPFAVEEQPNLLAELLKNEDTQAREESAAQGA